MSSVITTASNWLTDALGALDGPALLVSPYLTDGVCDRIATAAERSDHGFNVVTSLDAAAVASGYQTVQGLKQLLTTGVEIRHVDRLHAKCFVLGSRGMLGSANLTGAGVGSSAAANRELGVELDAEQLANAVQTIKSWPARLVSSADLDDLQAKSKALTRTVRDDADALDADTALSQAESLLADARDPGRCLWLKLEDGEPALEGWHQESYFASSGPGKPRFRPGDLVLICAKETKDCYAVVEVISEPEFMPADYCQWNGADDAERWPWVSRTKPRLVPSELMQLKLSELGVNPRSLEPGRRRLEFDRFTAAVRSLARLATG